MFSFSNQLLKLTDHSVLSEYSYCLTLRTVISGAIEHLLIPDPSLRTKHVELLTLPHVRRYILHTSALRDLCSSVINNWLHNPVWVSLPQNNYEPRTDTYKPLSKVLTFDVQQLYCTPFHTIFLPAMLAIRYFRFSVGTWISALSSVCMFRAN